MKINLLIFNILAAFSFILFASAAEAATLFLSPPASEADMGGEMTVDIRIDSEGESFNASQAVIRFPRDTIEVLSLDKTDSLFSFWLEEPSFSNGEGIISFIGGTPYGVSGSSVQILRIVFEVKASGSGTLAISDAAITASDGSGANILSRVVNAAFLIAPEEVTPEPPSVGEGPSETPATTEPLPPPAVPVLPDLPSPPKQIIREPVPTGKLPTKPVITIPLYPDESEWHDMISPFNVRWDLPLDVTNVSTEINNRPIYTPLKSEGLFDNKTFPALEDGVSYLHVRFKNNIGWGPVAHYRMAVDTQPPLGFDIVVLEGEATDNPTPTLQFKTNDALSGLKEYQIRIGSGDVIEINPQEFDGSFILPLQEPGTRQVLVRAVDLAGNGISNSVMLETIPIASPVITFVTRELFSDEDKGLTVKGTALLGIDVLVKIYRKEILVAEEMVQGDEMGVWEITFDQPLKNGIYKATARSQDSRGALSLVVESPKIKVMSRPIIQIGMLKLGMGGALIFLLVVLISGFAGGFWFYKTRQEKLALRVSFTESEITKIFKLIRSDIDRLTNALDTPTPADDEYSLNRLRQNIRRMEKYLKKGVGKIKR